LHHKRWGIKEKDNAKEETAEAAIERSLVEWDGKQASSKRECQKLRFGQNRHVKGLA